MGSSASGEPMPRDLVALGRIRSILRGAHLILDGDQGLLYKWLRSLEGSRCVPPRPAGPSPLTTLFTTTPKA
jgi:hypothetical protein